MSENNSCALIDEISNNSDVKSEEIITLNNDKTNSTEFDNGVTVNALGGSFCIPKCNSLRKRLSTDPESEVENENKVEKTENISDDSNKYVNGNTNCSNGSLSNNSTPVKGTQKSNKHNLSSSIFNHDSESKRIHMESKLNLNQLNPKDYLYKYMYVEKYENGGGYILHAYQDELSQLDNSDLELFVNRYFKCLFRETQNNNNHPYSLYCIGIIHGSARKLPDLLSYLADKYDNLIVKTNLMEFKNDVQTVTVGEYAKNVYKNYKNGLFRYGPLHSVSLVGTKGEETGGYFKDIIKHLERNPFLKQVMPWGPLSKLSGMSPALSNDGPILWIRHGEQAVPSSTSKKKRKISPSPNSNNSAVPIMNLPTTVRGGVIRQTAVNDRTHCHADHADDGLDRHTTAAVGVLKAVHPPNTKSKNGNYRVVKDVVCFDPRHYTDLIKRLKLDIMEPPASQCGNYWADDAELNQLRVEGYRFIRVWLRDNDIYFIPRNVVHQFKTISAVSSVAWHVRLRRYYHIPSTSSSSSTTTPGAKSSEETHNNNNHPISSASNPTEKNC